MFCAADVIWGWALIHFDAKAARFQQILHLSQGGGCCTEEDETHRHSLLFQHLCFKGNNFYPRSAKTPWGGSNYLNVPCGGGGGGKLGNGGVSQPWSV